MVAKEVKLVALQRGIRIHRYLDGWLVRATSSSVLPGQPLHPLKHALQIFTVASKEGWGADLNLLQGEPGPFQKASCTKTTWN